MEMRPCSRKFLYLLFAASGCCALIYEILWTKYLSLTFGTTILAVSTVAATFMGGLALGSYLLGRYADRETNLLRVYAFLELGIALTALLFAPTLALVESLYVALSQSLPTHLAISTTIRLVFSSLLLLPPAACMGGTFPLMCRFFARKKCGAQIGRLYALNTLGATLGAFCAGYFLIPSLGLSTTGHLAVSLNLIVAVASFSLSRKVGITSIKDISHTKRPEQPLQASRHRLLMISIALVGFFSLAYEILWTRVLLLFLGNTTYAFSLMLSAYLVGIALGGGIYARKARPEMDEKRVFITLTTLMGLSILVTAPFYDGLAHLFQFAHEASGERWWHLSMLSFMIVFAVMCIPTILSGSLLPAAVAILDPGKNRTGEGVGLVVLHNTIGAVFGSLMAGFVLIPVLGILGSFSLLAACNILLSLILYLRFRTRRRLGAAIPALVTAGIVLAITPISWDQKLMNSGVYCYAPAYKQLGGIKKALAKDRILEVIEDLETTIAIKESPDGKVRFLSVNGKTDASTGVDMATQVLIGQIPLLLHPDPTKVLVVGLGSGITLGGVMEYPLDKIDCVEISPGVVKAASYFSKENRSVLSKAKLNLMVEDGRNLLLTHDGKYDLIISQPSNPWQSGNANLFTAEFYRLGADRLKKNGLFCQWIGLYDITPQNLRISVRTFMQTFPRMLVFKAGADLIMVGSREKLTFDYGAMKRKMTHPDRMALFRDINISSPGDLIGQHFLFDETTMRDFAGEAPINSDNRPVLEFSFRHNLGGKVFGMLEKQNLLALQEAFQNLTLPLSNPGPTNLEIAQALKDIGAGYTKAGKKAESRYFLNLASEYEVNEVSNRPEKTWAEG